MSQTVPPAIDPEMLAELRAISGEGGRSLLDEMIDLFTEDSRKRIHALRAALAAGDGVEVAELAHSLKGSCSNFGALPLQTGCRELELAARAGDFDRAADHLDAVDRELTRVLVALAAEQV